MEFKNYKQVLNVLEELSHQVKFLIAENEIPNNEYKEYLIQHLEMIKSDLKMNKKELFNEYEGYGFPFVSLNDLKHDLSVYNFHGMVEHAEITKAEIEQKELINKKLLQKINL